MVPLCVLSLLCPSLVVDQAIDATAAAAERSRLKWALGWAAAAGRWRS